jgi:hypothetical protein
MKQGTISIIFGCHSIVHSYFVFRSWKKIYNKYPSIWELICILIHDWGHFGLQYLDDIEQKKRHWILGAKIAKYLFGDKGFNLCAGHCEYSGYPLSKLYKPDKMSQLHPYLWSFIYQAFEPKLTTGFPSKKKSWEHWQNQVRKSIESGVYRGSHEMYLERVSQSHSKNRRRKER